MRWRSNWPIALVGLLVLWLFAVLAAFYVVQRPFTPEAAQAVTRSALDVASAALVVTLGASLGRRILIWLDLGDLPLGELIWLAPGLGLGVLSLLTLGLGLAGGWRRAVIYGLVALAFAVLRRDTLALVRQAIAWRPELAVGKWGRRYLVTTLALTLVLALAPPTSWDGLFYHLTGPALYIDQGGVAPLDVNIPHLAFPSLMEMLFGLAMLLRGDVAAKLVHLAYGLLLAALVYRLSRRWMSRDVARWSLLLLVSMPMVAVLAVWAYNDLALAFYQLAALYALLAWREDGRRGWLVVAGLLSGFALGLKYTAFPLPLVGLAYLLWQPRERWRGVGIFVIVTSLVAAPWYLRNWAFTGNPVYPFIFGGRAWDPFRAAWYAHGGTGIGWRPLQILALPATMTLGLRDVNYHDGRMGPLFLALAPVLIWAVVRTWRTRTRAGVSMGKRHAFILLGGFAAVSAAIWTFGVIQSRALFQARLFLPGFVALVPLLAEGLVQLSALDQPGFSVSRFVRLAIGVVLVLALIDQTLGVLRVNPFPYLVGYESRSNYLSRALGDHYEAMEEIGEIVPENGRVLFLWEPRSYYSPRHSEPDAILDKWAHLVHVYRDEGRIAAHLREEGYTHVLLNQRGLDFVIEEGESPLSAADVKQLQALLEHELMLVEGLDRYFLYELRE